MIMIQQLVNEYKTVMEPILHPDAFDDDDYIYQLKWDGVRMLAFFENEEVFLINKHAHERTQQYIELQDLPGFLQAKSAVLDGEIVVLKEGKPSFPAVMRRDGSRESKTIQYMKNLLPVQYMVFDLLYLNGRDLRNEPLTQRKYLLEQILTVSDFLHVVEDFNGGKALFEAVDNMGMEGIVAKHKTGLYLPGKQHRDWYKIKCRRTQYCLIGGFTLRGRVVNSLLVGVYREGEFSFAGKVSSGLNHSQMEILTAQLPDLETKISPFTNLKSAKPDYHFIKPQIGARVEYLEWSEDMKLRSPVIKDFLQLHPEDCNV